MLLHALEDFEGEVESVEVLVGAFDQRDDAEALVVVIKTAVVFEQAVESLFAGVTEGGVSKVMRESNGFGQVLIESEGAGQGAADGRDFHGMGESRAVMVAGAVEKDLGFVFETAKGGRMDDAGNVALVFAAPAVRRLRVETSAGGRGFLGEGREVFIFLALDIFAGAEEGHGQSIRSLVAVSKKRSFDVSARKSMRWPASRVSMM